MFSPYITHTAFLALAVAVAACVQLGATCGLGAPALLDDWLGLYGLSDA